MKKKCLCRHRATAEAVGCGDAANLRTALGGGRPLKSKQRRGGVSILGGEAFYSAGWVNGPVAEDNES